MKQQTYVHGEVEVKLTGRFAVKQLPGNKTLKLVEVTPANEYDGTFKKFVAETSLLLIQGDSSE